MSRGGKEIDIFEKIVRQAIENSPGLENVLIQCGMPDRKSIFGRGCCTVEQKF